MTSYSRLFREKVPWAIRKRAREQANKMQHCGLSKHFSSLCYLPVWTHTQTLCLHRWRGETEKMQEKLLWLLEIPSLNKQSDNSIALSQKAALVIQSSLQNRLVHGLLHESLPLSSRNPCSRKYQSIKDTVISSECKKMYFNFISLLREGISLCWLSQKTDQYRKQLKCQEVLLTKTAWTYAVAVIHEGIGQACFTNQQCFLLCKVCGCTWTASMNETFLHRQSGRRNLQLSALQQTTGFTNKTKNVPGKAQAWISLWPGTNPYQCFS